ncbi:MAG TPA: hypothetical protein PLV72_03070 [Candidatus Magasanikbacteria bacterium]|nr:hypothetical protein [Candidatus Magasanikbacteria bacterium]
MIFFEKHFQRETFFHTPHKWFIAFLISPIHFFETQYRQHYHLRFTHARKLFIFDLGLICLALGLIISTLYWLTYDPTLTRSLELTITPTLNTRILSGQNISFRIDYRNNSPEKIIAPELSILLPHGFYLKNISLPNFSTSTHSVSLPDLPAGANGQMEFSGQYFSTPGDHSPIITSLSYHRDESNKAEQKNTQYLIHTADSMIHLKTGADFPKQLIAGTNANFSIDITLEPKFQQNDIIPAMQTFLGGSRSFDITKLELEADGKIFPCAKNLMCDLPQNFNQLKMNGKLFIPKNIVADSVDIEFYSRFLVDEKYIDQSSITKSLPLVRPEISIVSEIENMPRFVSGGEIIKLNGRIRNAGSVSAEHARLSLVLPKDIIDTKKIISLNHAELTNSILTVNEHFDAKYISLSRDEPIPFVIILPLRANLPNDVEKFSVKLLFSATLDDLANTAYETSAESPSLTIAPRPTLAAEARYFTPEGDQIGRGPIPPSVGKETKYWILIRYSNSYSELRNLNFSAQLPSGAVWTGRNSVSLGAEISFDQMTRNLSWTMTRLSPHTTVGLNFEIAYTPTAKQKGAYFDLLKEIKFSAFEPTTNQIITKTISNINSKLDTDSEAQIRGTSVR